MKLLVLHIVHQLFRLERVDALVTPHIVQLEFVFDSDLLLTELLLLIVRGPWHPCESLVLLCPCVVDVSILAPPVEVHHLDSINQDSLLDLLVKGTICHETWRLVHLDQPRLCLLVEEDVNAEDLHAKLVLKVLGFGRSVDVSDVLVT